MALFFGGNGEMLRRALVILCSKKRSDRCEMNGIWG